MKYVKLFWHTYVIVGEPWWKWHVWISSKVDPLIRIAIQSDDLSSPPAEKVLVVGCWHPTSSLSPHHLGPPCHGWIVRSTQNNRNSMSQSWNLHEEKATQDRSKLEVPLTTLFALFQLALHVSEQWGAPVIHHGSQALYWIENKRPWYLVQRGQSRDPCQKEDNNIEA